MRTHWSRTLNDCFPHPTSGPSWDGLDGSLSWASRAPRTEPSNCCRHSWSGLPLLDQQHEKSVELTLLNSRGVFQQPFETAQGPAAHHPDGRDAGPDALTDLGVRQALHESPHHHLLFARIELGQGRPQTIS